MRGRKYTYEEVKDYIEKTGYKLLSKEYIDNKHKLDILCDRGHRYKAAFVKFRGGRRCPICAGNVKYTYDEVLNFVKSIGYTLISTEYINARTKLHMICSNGHDYYAPFYSLLQGFRCGKCKHRVRYTYEEVKKYVEDNKYTLLSKTYKNNKTILDMKCPKGHLHKTTFDNFKRGYRCKKCYIENNVGENHPNYNPNLTSRIRNRHITGYSKWKQKILKRDNHRCRICGAEKRGKKSIVVHHIESYDNNPEMRTSLKNGITLCRNCHDEFHHIFGYGNNTEKQFVEYVKLKESELK